MGIKQRLAEVRDWPAKISTVDVDMRELCSDAIAEIERQAEMIRGLQIEVDAARASLQESRWVREGSEQLLTIATHLMAAQLRSEWHSGRVYNMEAMASDAVNAAEALIKELRTR